MRIRFFTWFFLVTAAALLWGGGESGHLSPGSLFLASLVNFALFLFVLIKLGKAPISSFFAAREAEIRTAFETYHAEYERAEAEIARLRQAIADLPAEKKRTLADYRRRAEEIYAARIKEAHAHAAYIREASEAILRSEIQARYLSAISAFADRLTRDLAERARSLDAAHHAALVQSGARLFEKMKQKEKML